MQPLPNGYQAISCRSRDRSLLAPTENDLPTTKRGYSVRTGWNFEPL